MIIRKSLVILTVLWLAACSSSQSGKSYYQLPSMTTGTNQKGMVSPDRQLQLTGVNVADYLNGLGIVYQTNDVKYVMASNNLWAGSLQQQLQQALIENLNAGLPGWLITGQHIQGNQKTLSVNVTGFHGRYDGAVIVRGDWILSDGGRILIKPFGIQLMQQGDGYDSLVRTLAKAWKQQNDEMAEVIVNTTL